MRQGLLRRQVGGSGTPRATREKQREHVLHPGQEAPSPWLRTKGRGGAGAGGGQAVLWGI